MGISNLCQGCCGSISLPCVPHCQVCNAECPEGQIGSFLSPTQQVQSVWQAVSKNPWSLYVVRSLCNRTESLPPWWIDKLSLTNKSAGGDCRKLPLEEVFCSALSQPVSNPCRGNVVNYTITCRLLAYRGYHDLAGWEGLDCFPEIGFSEWDRVRLLVWKEPGWSSPSVSSFSFLLVHCPNSVSPFAEYTCLASWGSLMKMRYFCINL